MRGKIFRSFAFLVVLAILLTFFAGEYVSYREISGSVKKSAATEAMLLADIYREAGSEAMLQAALKTEARTTLISPTGKVEFDSAETRELMENHCDRPEFLAAVNSGSGESLRMSSTLGEETYYYSLRLADGKVLRLSYTRASIVGKAMADGVIVILLAILGFGFCLLVARRLAGSLVQPINALDLDNLAEADSYEEISPLIRRINLQKKKLAEQLAVMAESRERYLAITENMAAGLIVTDREKVLLLNRAAQQIFAAAATDCIGHSIMTVSRDEGLRRALTAALSGENFSENIERDGEIYELHGAAVKDAHADIMGAVLLIQNVTAREYAEKMRREFTANVSHELKTPLMSISGYAELINSGMARPEDVKDFSGRIYKEAGRLKNLVNDIIKLSQIEETTAPNMESVDLYGIAREAARDLADYAAKNEVQIEVTGESVKINGIRQLLYEMVLNLVENAIKYNHAGGKVKISLRQNGDEIVLSVADTGIGIAKENQGRIFERFYRVDKSRSSQTGGTGLGLSIVKHIAKLHGAKLHLDSTLGKGTRITAVFKA